MHNRAMRDASRGRVLFLCCLVLSFALMLALNAQTPLMMDDYDYSFSWSTGERLNGVWDVLASQAAHYRLWGGRSVVHTLAQLFLLLGKPVFNVANAAMYILLLLEVLALAGYGPGKADSLRLLLAHGVMMAGVPFFGTVFLWLDGACNYLWGTALALLPLLIAASERSGGFFDGGWARGAWALPIAFLAGWTNENTACGVLALCALLLAADWRRGRCVRAWRLAAWAAQLLGVLALLLAPGNFARAAQGSGGGPLHELLYRAAVVTLCLARSAWLPALVGAALLLAGRKNACKSAQGRAAFVRAGALALCALLSAYALAASPQISDRAFTGVLTLMLAAALSLPQPGAAGRRGAVAAALAGLAILLTGAQALRDVCAHEAAWNAQLARIDEAISAGKKEAVLDGVPSSSRFAMGISLAEEPEQWPNSTLSRYFGVAICGSQAGE